MELAQGTLGYQLVVSWHATDGKEHNLAVTWHTEDVLGFYFFFLEEGRALSRSVVTLLSCLFCTAGSTLEHGGQETSNSKTKS